MPRLHGSTEGLKAQQVKDLERLFRRRVEPQHAASLELLRELAEWSAGARRRVGVLIDRRGRIPTVLVGTATMLPLPDELVAAEQSGGRFCGLRWVMTGPFEDEPSRRDLTALLKARFDLLIQLACTEDGRPWSLREAWLRPPNPDGSRGPTFEISEPLAPHQLRKDLLDHIGALEDEFERAHPTAVTPEGVEPERVVIVTVGTEGRRHLERQQAELRELVESAGGHIVGELLQRREALDPRTHIGAGLLQDLTVTCVRRKAELVVFGTSLSAAQARAIEAATGLAVLDRPQIILDLFAQSARSSAGKLQVELARLRYILPRLAGRGEAYSQIGAGGRVNRGIGSNRGVGEKKLELDRRAIRRRIRALERKLSRHARHREMGRARRQRTEVSHVALVGYTNAGKSTLFNRLTGAQVETADRLFATLDPTVRRRRLDSDLRLVFSDTVGFIEALPQDLVDAFGATLEELSDARLRLHIVDASAPDVHLKVRAVRELLRALELDASPEILVFNKADLVNVDEYLPIARQLDPDPLFVSAVTGAGLDALVARVEAELLALATAQP